MCGIVAAIAERNITPILIDGLHRLEYRGYDSAGLAVLNGQGLHRLRAVGKVNQLAAIVDQRAEASVGLAHTRWATHGAPTRENAHPHVSGERLALVHNGIVENHHTLREELERDGYRFASETDSEVVVHMIHRELTSQDDLLTAVARVRDRLEGQYAFAVLDARHPEQVVAARMGSPLVIGVGIDEHFLASDAAALVPVTQQIIYLQDGDVVRLLRTRCEIIDRSGNTAQRPLRVSSLSADTVEKGAFRHFMQKEIHEQPDAMAATLQAHIDGARLLPSLDPALLRQVRAVRIIACGTSYHAGQVARYWIEALARVPVLVEVASEYRYRTPAAPDNTLFVAISQSGETADTLAALSQAVSAGYLATIGICNVPESALTRVCDLTLLTEAGIEIGVASTKAFTTQLVVLLLLATALAEAHGLPPAKVRELIEHLGQTPQQAREVLTLDEAIADLASTFADKHHALFLGRGPEYPIAMEGALKLKEISYIHAEAYAAGELKHGPLALVDETLPVVVCASSNALLEKLKSNLSEVRARGGRLIVFADRGVTIADSEDVRIIRMPLAHSTISPIMQVIPLQMLAYHVGVVKGTDVDQPRNLAKSVTVE